MRETTEMKVIDNMIKELTIELISYDSKINDIFSEANSKSVLGNEFILEGFRRSFYKENKPYEINVRVKNSVYHWASEIVRSEIKIYDTGEVEADFSAGSGGWNDFPTKEILDVFSSSLNMIKEMIKIAENNSLDLYNLCSERYEIENEISELWGKARAIKRKIKIENQAEKANEVMKHHVKVDAKTLLKELTSTGNDFTRINLVSVEIHEDSFYIDRTSVEFECYGNKRFSLDDKRISKKVLNNFDFSNYYYRTLAHGNKFYGTRRDEK